jgi:hypothetical protein
VRLKTLLDTVMGREIDVPEDARVDASVVAAVVVLPSLVETDQTIFPDQPRPPSPDDDDASNTMLSQAPRLLGDVSTTVGTTGLYGASEVTLPFEFR